MGWNYGSFRFSYRTTFLICLPQAKVSGGSDGVSMQKHWSKLNMFVFEYVYRGSLAPPHILPPQVRGHSTPTYAYVVHESPPRTKPRSSRPNSIDLDTHATPSEQRTVLARCPRDRQWSAAPLVVSRRSRYRQAVRFGLQWMEAAGACKKVAV